MQLFIYNACCFIGIGLREHELRQLFLACAAFRRTQQRDHPHVEPPRHYAVMPMLYRKTADAGVNERDLEAEGVEARTFADLGITVVRYEPVDERHLGLIQLFGECLQLPTVPIRSGFEPETIE